MNLQFTDLDTDPDMKQFYDYINDVETICQNFVGANPSDYLSQIKRDKNKKYDPYLVTKLPFRYNRFEVDIYSDTSLTSIYYPYPPFGWFNAISVLIKYGPAIKNFAQNGRSNVFIYYK